MRYLALLLFLAFSHAEIIDRIAVTVDRRVITESEILRQIRITAFLNQEKPNFTLANRRITADRLVEQILIRGELQMSSYSPSEAPATEEYQQLVKRYSSEEEYQRALKQYGITDADVREALAWQAGLLEFIDVRFRPGVQIPAAEIREYYDEQATQNPGKLPPFEDAKDDIERILTELRVDSALDRWLGQARTQSRIRYVREVFQ